MDTDRTHRATSADGTEIAGRVLGQGPPIVFVHGALDDGALDWEFVPSMLGDRFTCYIMALRSRGASGHSNDLAPGRLVEDVTAFVESIGEPVGLVGTSGGGMSALGAAGSTPAVSGVAAYEPVVFEAIEEETLAGLQDVLERMATAAADGRMTDAARIFFEPVLNDEEREALSGSDFFEVAARYVAVDIAEIRQAAEFQGTGPTDPAVLARVTAPVLLMHGSRSAMGDWITAGLRHVADHVGGARVLELAGAGHLAPSLHPERVASELSHFFAPALASA